MSTASKPENDTQDQAPAPGRAPAQTDAAKAQNPAAAAAPGPALDQPGGTKDKTGRASGAQAYGDATRDKVKASPYAPGRDVVTPGAPGAGYDKTKAGIQPQKPGGPAAANKPGAPA